MLEPTAFFEPYRAVLHVLQNFPYETFPIMNYILGWEKEKLPPLYLVKQPMCFLRDAKGTPSTMRNLEYEERNREKFSSLPVALTQDLDISQQEALDEALTSRLALIQGPPGTGKTFLALRILRSLLSKRDFWQGAKVDNWNDTRTPIVVICYTVRYLINSFIKIVNLFIDLQNHALDQFLEGVLAFTDQIIRIGGQSKSTLLENLTMYQCKERALRKKQTGTYTESSYVHYFYQMTQV